MVGNHRIDRALKLPVPVADEVTHSQEVARCPQCRELFVGVEHQGRAGRTSRIA